MRAKTHRRLGGFRKLAVVGMLAAVLPFTMGGCELGEFTSTSTVTLSGREVVSFLVRSWIFTPIQTAIDDGINSFFDRIEDEDD